MWHPLLSRLASRRLLLLGCLVAAVAPPIPAADGQTVGRVVAVADGDTITVEIADGSNITVRLHGVDAPEGGQDFGNRAKQFTSRMAFGKSVRLVIKDHDRYGRTVARVLVDGDDLCIAIVRAGLAWHYRQYSDDLELAAAEREAQAARRGLWVRSDAVPPWEYRHPAAASARPLGDQVGEFHGNVRSHVYHAPGCQHYNCKNCTAVFESREAAEAAGYRAHSACVKPEPK